MVTGLVFATMRARLAIAATALMVTIAVYMASRRPVKRSVSAAPIASTPKPSTACGEPTPPGGDDAAATVSGARPLSSMMSATRRSECVFARIASRMATDSAIAAMTAA